MVIDSIVDALNNCDVLKGKANTVKVYSNKLSIGSIDESEETIYIWVSVVEYKDYVMVSFQNVSISDVRKGIFTGIINCVKDVDGVNDIQIMNVLTESMVNFCEKNKFKNMNNAFGLSYELKVRE